MSRCTFFPGCRGPGYPSPLAAMEGPTEKLMYIACIQSQPEIVKKPDYLATVDIDPESDTYCQVRFFVTLITLVI